MNSKAELKKFESSIATIRVIARVFQNAAARKMKINEDEIAKVEEYLQQAIGTYSQTKFAIMKGSDHKLKKELKNTVVGSKSRKVLVLISSETQYFGTLVQGLVLQFIEEFKGGGCDGIILGKIGKELVDRQLVVEKGDEQSRGTISFYNLSDDNPDYSIIKNLTSTLAAYQEIVVFYGKYESVFRQEGKKIVLTKSFPVPENLELKKYLIRPRTRETVSFLEEQLVAGRLLQKLFESGLAKFGYRVKILQIGQVAERISQAMNTLVIEKRRYSKTTKNKKQNQLFSGRELWS